MFCQHNGISDRIKLTGFQKPFTKQLLIADFILHKWLMKKQKLEKSVLKW
jgi:hypothetical protein